MTIIAFILGSMFGGLISTVLLCCMQMNRICDYESEIRRLREKLNNK